MVWYGMAWNGMAWPGMIWYDMACTYVYPATWMVFISFWMLPAAGHGRWNKSVPRGLPSWLCVAMGPWLRGVRSSLAPRHFQIPGTGGTNMEPQWTWRTTDINQIFPDIHSSQISAVTEFIKIWQPLSSDGLYVAGVATTEVTISGHMPVVQVF